jgi:transcriptional regulator with XRE-family HTH domain
LSRVGEQLKKAREESGMSMKQLGKKLGVSESFVNEVEQGRRVVNEALLERFTKVFGKDVTKMGLGSLEASVTNDEPEVRRVQLKPREEYKAPATPVSELWNQAFGDNIKNIPVYDYGMVNPIENRTYAVTGKKIEGHPADKVVAIKVMDDDLLGFRIAKGDLVLCTEVKEIQGTSFLLVEYKGKRMLRKAINLNNGNIMLLSNKSGEKSETMSVKDVKPLMKVFKVEFFI